MLTTRNFRLVVALVALITIVGLIASSHGSINDQIQAVKDKAAEKIPSSGASSDDNTLQGKPYAGTEAPYSADKVTGAGNTPGSGSNAPPKKPLSESGSGAKPVIMADTSDSLKNHADKPKPGSSEDNTLGPGANSVDGTEADTEGNVNVALEDETDTSVGKAAPAAGKAASGGNCDERNFVVMIDAGSTGSRVHVYEFNTCQSPPVLIAETFEMLKPGLSSFDTDTVGAAKSLDPLMEVALKTVPKNKQGCTPVAVKATAGLRLLGDEKSANILKQVRTHLENDYPFAVVEGDGISMMDGKDEGVYAWITTNYLLGNIGSADKTPTAAVFDLGGGSTQIVFEPDFSAKDEMMIEGEHKYKLSFGNRDFILYQYSHLGYGLMQGRNKVNGLVVESHLKTDDKLKNSKITKKESLKDAKASVTISNPCIAPGMVANDVQVEVGKDEYYVVNMKGPSKEADVNTGATCRALAEKVLNKELECSEKPCSYNGIYQPSLTKSFKKSSDMFVFSYFYDRTNPLGFPSSFTVGELTELSKLVCGGDQFWAEALLDDHVKALNEEPQWCLDLSFITAMLHTGYDIPLQRELKTAKTIDNNELGWCLGASLPLLDKTGWSCRVEDISK